MSHPRTGDARFRARVDQIVAFRRRHGRFPTRYAKNDTDERSLAYFLQRIRQSDRGKTTDVPLSPERIAMLNDVLPGWRGRGAHYSMDQNIARLGAFVDERGHLPRHQPEDETERALSIFAARARAIAAGRARGAFTATQLQLLDDTAPGWRLTARERTVTDTES